MQGQNDPEYESIIRAVTAITFLSTPHRGTNLAELLDRILRSTIVSNSKYYISELAKNSYTLQKLNEQFRHIAPRLDIVSFYETQSTSIGFRNARIVSGCQQSLKISMLICGDDTREGFVCARISWRDL